MEAHSERIERCSGGGKACSEVSLLLEKATTKSDGIVAGPAKMLKVVEVVD